MYTIQQVMHNLSLLQSEFGCMYISDVCNRKCTLYTTPKLQTSESS